MFWFSKFYFESDHMIWKPYAISSNCGSNLLTYKKIYRIDVQTILTSLDCTLLENALISNVRGKMLYIVSKIYIYCEYSLNVLILLFLATVWIEAFVMFTGNYWSEKKNRELLVRITDPKTFHRINTQLLRKFYFHTSCRYRYLITVDLTVKMETSINQTCCKSTKTPHSKPYHILNIS